MQENPKERYSLKFAKGETKLSRILFAFLDILFLPNLHDVIKSVNRKNPEFDIFEKSKLVLRQLDWDRTVLAVIFGIMFWFEIITWDRFIQLLIGV